MGVIAIQALGALTFLIGTVWLGRRIRRSTGRAAAERASRIGHLLFWTALVAPGTVGIFYPGLRSYDRILGLPSLPGSGIRVAASVMLLSLGLVLVVGSHRFLLSRGRGAAAFFLTERLVTGGLYGRTRNPMSLGFYAACMGVGLLAGSTTVILSVVLVLVPTHVMYLKLVEEPELARRFGSDYADYRERVPFLVPRPRRARDLPGESARRAGRE